MEDGCVVFKSQIIKTEARKPVALLRSDIRRSTELIRICSMCKQIAISETKWEEVEIAVQKMALFEKKVLPQFTHSVCPPCYQTAMAELDDLAKHPA